jgi:hypothetical protein
MISVGVVNQQKSLRCFAAFGFLQLAKLSADFNTIAFSILPNNSQTHIFRQNAQKPVKSRSPGSAPVKSSNLSCL